MTGRRYAIVLVGLVVLTLLAATGWLAGSRSWSAFAADAKADAPADEHLLVVVLRASAAVRTAGQFGSEHPAPQSAVIEAVSALSERSTLPGWDDLDVLFIDALERIQRRESGSVDEETTRTMLLAAADEIDRTIDGLVAGVTAAGDAAPRFPVAGLLAAMSLLLGGMCIAMIAVRSRGEVVADAAGKVRPEGRRGTTSAMRDGMPPAGLRDDPADEEPAPAMPAGVFDAERLERALEEERSRCTRYGHDLSAVVLSFNEAERVRRDHGASAVWYVVTSIAELVLTNTRASDRVAILADERICVLAPETSREQIELLARKLGRNVELFPFDVDIPATVSWQCMDALAESPLT